MSAARIIVATSLALAGVGAPILAPMPIRLIWNASASVPIGFYTLDVDGPFGVSDLVAVNVQGAIATLFAERGYLPSGLPLIKHILAVSGQTVCRKGTVITIDAVEVGEALERDRAGRGLPVWQGCSQVAGDEVFLMNAEVRDSLDGRYFGPVSTNQIVGRAVPLWTDEDGSGRFEWRALHR